MIHKFSVDIFKLSHEFFFLESVFTQLVFCRIVQKLRHNFELSEISCLFVSFLMFVSMFILI